MATSCTCLGWDAWGWGEEPGSECADQPSPWELMSPVPAQSSCRCSGEHNSLLCHRVEQGGFGKSTGAGKTQAGAITLA